jgi:hypothetical protein
MPTDLTITGFEDRPGVAASIGEALGNANVDVEGLFGSGRLGEIHVLVSDVAAARGAIGDIGLQVSDEREALVVDAQARPGELGRIARRIADAGVNIIYLYVASNNRLVFVAEDVERARDAIRD